MSKQAVIFDLDGTLLNTLEDLRNSTNYALDKFGYPKRTLDEVRTFVGNGVKKLILRAMDIEKESENPDFDQVFAAFQAHYKEHSNDLTAPYPSVPELLKELHARGIPMAIVSNKLDAAVKALNEIYFKEYITVAIGENEAAGVRKKPAPDTVYAALSQLGCDKAVYVGDSEVDLATAKNSGLPCIPVTWGFRDEDWLLAHGATKLFHTPQEVLAEILRRQNQRQGE
jgi:phosphoglycolate phosphatase